MAVSTRKKKKRKSRKRLASQSLGPGDDRHRIIRAEFDSHADTCTLKKGDCLVLGETGRTVEVSGFHKRSGKLDSIPVVHAAVAYDCPKTGETVILVFHEALLIESMKTHLLNHYQICNAGLIVNETPLHQLPLEERTSTSHSVISIDPEFQIPLSLNGIMSGFDVRLPTWDEVNNPDNKIIHMTSEEEWDPKSGSAQDLEENIRDNLDRETVLLHQEPRKLGLLQVRGPDKGEQL